MTDKKRHVTLCSLSPPPTPLLPMSAMCGFVAGRRHPIVIGWPQRSNTATFVTLTSSGAMQTEHRIPPHRQCEMLCVIPKPQYLIKQMNKFKPNYTDFGFSSSMGPELRTLVEHHLINDLAYYGVNLREAKFDWSQSCIEGHHTRFLDGSLENFSGIAVFDDTDTLVAEGWVEFIHEFEFFLCYWEFVTTLNADKKISEKREPGIPDHIWIKIPDSIKPALKDQKMKESPWK